MVGEERGGDYGYGGRKKKQNYFPFSFSSWPFHGPSLPLPLPSFLPSFSSCFPFPPPPSSLSPCLSTPLSPPLSLPFSVAVQANCPTSAAEAGPRALQRGAQLKIALAGQLDFIIISQTRARAA
jgi:hypothetical protein